ncbi:hypothetical protein KIN20_006054 [Parelaphostrongylus tenuis]|uniref:Uncharacterized protein n=1 Tax=Parelaphostrongylus tenuis TaxID=148309 RepID=A0AAD5QGE5_PARTN|nr:hypothetical protein KIN20_006054 [Parelaphostrongylus tenuis]
MRDDGEKVQVLRKTKFERRSVNIGSVEVRRKSIVEILSHFVPAGDITDYCKTN